VDYKRTKLKRMYSYDESEEQNRCYQFSNPIHTEMCTSKHSLSPHKYAIKVIRFYTP